MTPKPSETIAKEENRLLQKQVVDLAWPVMAEMLLQTFAEIVSMILVGHLGASAVTAIGLSMQPTRVMQAIFMGLGVGTTAVVARLYGQQNYREAGKASAQALSISVISALFCACATALGANAIVRWMGGEPEVTYSATRYLLASTPGLFFMWVQTVLSGCLRGAGDTKTPMKINLIINVVNLGATAVLVYGLFGIPRLGVFGAGLATTLARAIGALLMLAPFLQNRSVLSVAFPKDFGLDLRYAGRIIRVGLPGALERLLFSGGMMVYSKMVATLGTVAFAAHTIGITAESISFMPGMGFGTAATTLVGQKLGADRPDQAEQATYRAFWLSAAFVTIMSALFLALPEQLIRMYTNDAEVIRLAAVYLRIYAFCQIHQAASAVFSGALRGAGDTRFVMYITIFADTVVLLGGTALLLNTFKLGLVGAWLGMALEGLFRAVAFVFWFRTNRWKLIQV